MTEELFREDAYRTHCTGIVEAAEDDARVILDQTVFYARGGGQPGDRGWLVLSDGRSLEVIDTVRDAATGDIVHVLTPSSALPPPGVVLTAEVDWPRRHRLMRMHSALHLLCRAVGAPVTGGQIDDGKGRLDFDLGNTPIDRDTLTERLRRWIAEDRPIRPFWIDEAELESRPELVRTLSVRPPRGQGRIRLVEIEGVDLQACGGTHVRSTAEIGAVAVTKIESKGKRNRRISLTLLDPGT
ncbi:alanyl-tRNA editing protein [Benzoatithermus flavus]|uniref:Alanine--tRNA ligase n=1 Tax=Benzoatithermus flavus TaxID=3108223 RepID=A0ABU8XRF8_9PROT